MRRSYLETMRVVATSNSTTVSELLRACVSLDVAKNLAAQAWYYDPHLALREEELEALPPLDEYLAVPETELRVTLSVVARQELDTYTERERCSGPAEYILRCAQQAWPVLDRGRHLETKQHQGPPIMYTAQTLLNES